jgi:hypothetical protein
MWVFVLGGELIKEVNHQMKKTVKFVTPNPYQHSLNFGYLAVLGRHQFVCGSTATV